MRAVLFAILAALALPAAATGIDCGQPQPFFVSMLLSREDAPTVVRLVHSQQPACSRAGAEANFARAVRKEFIGYRIVDTITTPVEAGCGETKRSARGFDV